MNLGIDGTEFAEVVYQTNDVLVVSVAPDLVEDSLLTNSLIDVIATAQQSDTAESAIAVIAAGLDLEVQTAAGLVRGERHLTIRSPLLTPSQRIRPEARA
jgi:hypothetical protein